MRWRGCWGRRRSSYEPMLVLRCSMIHLPAFLILVVCSIGLFHNEDDIYEFIPSNTITKYHSVGNRNCLGTIDSDGNFIPNSN